MERSTAAGWGEEGNRGGQCMFDTSRVVLAHGLAGRCDREGGVPVCSQPQRPAPRQAVKINLAADIAHIAHGQIYTVPPSKAGAHLAIAPYESTTMGQNIQRSWLAAFLPSISCCNSGQPPSLRPRQRSTRSTTRQTSALSTAPNSPHWCSPPVAASARRLSSTSAASPPSARPFISHRAHSPAPQPSPPSTDTTDAA